MKLTAKQIKQEILDMVEQGIFDPNEPYIFEDLPDSELFSQLSKLYDVDTFF